MAKTGLFVVKVPSLDANLDGFSNHFVFESDTATDFSTATNVYTAIEAFYNSITSGATNALRSYMALSLDGGSNHASITVYDITTHLNGVTIGAPVQVVNWTFSAVTSGTVTPEGVSAVISYQAAYGTDVEFGTGTRPRARDRNRMYLGPLNATAFSADSTTHRCKLSSTLTTDALISFNALGATHGSWNLRQWSRKNAAIKPVIEAWMDDRPDYQRRRSDPTPGTRLFESMPGG